MLVGRVGGPHEDHVPDALRPGAHAVVAAEPLLLAARLQRALHPGVRHEAPGRVAGVRPAADVLKEDEVPLCEGKRRERKRKKKGKARVVLLERDGSEGGAG